MLPAIAYLTAPEFLAFVPDEDDITYELIDGQAVPKMSPKFSHAKLTRAFLNRIAQWSEGRGEVLAEWAIQLTRKGQDWIPTPDLLYISYQRLPKDWHEDEACPVPPELAIEIISPGQTFGKLAAKARDYLDAKVLRVWVVDSQARSITVFYPDAPPQTYMGDTLLIDSLFEGLEFSAEEIFQQANIPIQQIL